MSKNKCKPLWMPLYVEKFLADTAHLSPSQGGAYVRLLCKMWLSEDGTLPNDPALLARVGGVYPPKWKRVWGAIKSLFDVDGDLVTNADLQAELGKANAIIVTRRAIGSLGGQTTQIRRGLKTDKPRVIGTPVRPQFPNDINGTPQANAEANYNYYIVFDTARHPWPPHPGVVRWDS
jgi:uncharacterized protein YdaU (DUF1376 family)